MKGYIASKEKIEFREDNQPILKDPPEVIKEQERRRAEAEFRGQTGMSPEAFEVIQVLKKLVTGEVIGISDKKKVTDFVNKYEAKFEELRK